MIRQLLFLVLASSSGSTVPAHLAFPKNLKLPLWNETYVDRLRQNLLLNYDKFSRPAQHYNTTTVFLYLKIMQVEIDSKKSVLSVNTWVRMTWNDEKLKWNPEDYGGVEEITVSAHEIWQPDLVLYNSASYGVENYESRQCIVRRDGMVLWIAPTVLHSFCKLNLKLWPFETNVCRLDLVSWTHSGDEVDIQLHNEGFDLEYYTAGEWKVRNISARRAKGTDICCSNVVCCPVIYYNIKLTRSSRLYYHVVFAACLPMVFLVLLTFWMRPQSEIKLIIIIFALIIDILVLLYFGYRIPARPGSLPVIVKFFSGCLCQLTVSIIICGFVIHISTSSYDISIPRRVRALLFGKVGKYLGLWHTINEVETQKLTDFQESINLQPTSLANSDLSISRLDDGNRRCMILQSKSGRRLEWIIFATAIDRCSFLLFCGMFALSAIAYARIDDDDDSVFSKKSSDLSSSTTPYNLTNNALFLR